MWSKFFSSYAFLLLRNVHGNLQHFMDNLLILNLFPLSHARLCNRYIPSGTTDVHTPIDSQPYLFMTKCFLVTKSIKSRHSTMVNPFGDVHIPIKSRYRVRQSDMEMPASLQGRCGYGYKLRFKKNPDLATEYKSQESLQREQCAKLCFEPVTGKEAGVGETGASLEKLGM